MSASGPSGPLVFHCPTCTSSKLYKKLPVYSANVLSMQIVSKHIFLVEESLKICFVIVCYHNFRLQGILPKYLIELAVL